MGTKGAFSSVTSDISEASTEIEKFATKVLKALIEENVPPIPYYFNVYFSNLLEEESYDFKKQVLEMTELEESNEAESSMDFEKKLKY